MIQIILILNIFTLLYVTSSLFFVLVFVRSSEVVELSLNVVLTF